MEIKEKIGNNLKSFREGLGFSQDQVANYLGLDRVMVSYYETGNRPTPIPILMKLADFFGVSLKEILEENPRQSELNKAFAFRAESITDSDMEVIASFKRIARNYIELKGKAKND